MTLAELEKRLASLGADRLTCVRDSDSRLWRAELSVRDVLVISSVGGSLESAVLGALDWPLPPSP